jgi:hypothetical protein
VFVFDTNDPETCPFDDTPQFNEVQLPGETATVQLVAAEEKPSPVNENCVPIVPDAGVTLITGITVRVADITSFPGEPTT